MALDSAAVFRDRVIELGLGECLTGDDGAGGDTGTFGRSGWTTYADLAFATSHVPGQPEGEAFNRDIVVAALGREDHSKRSSLRRLFFEAFTLAAADLKRRVEVNADDAPRKVPAAEREERRARVEARLTGLDLRNELDCSNRLVDTCIEVYEEDVLRYIAPEDATKKDMELAGIKKDRTWAVDATGAIKEKVVADRSKADISSGLLLAYALRRRGLAFEMADLLDYNIHDRLVEKLMATLIQQPLPGYAKVSIEQLLRADRLAFKLMAERTRKGVKRDSLLKRPCDIALPLVLDDPDFRQALASLPGQLTRHVDETDERPDPKKRKTRTQKMKELREHLQASKGGPHTTRARPRATRATGCRSSSWESTPRCPTEGASVLPSISLGAQLPAQAQSARGECTCAASRIAT